MLEAAAPAPGPLAPFHRFHLARVIPLAGRLSPDPSAYEYLGRSILEFGAGPEFEADLEQAGFVIEGRRSFMMGATRLWVARWPGRADRSEGAMHRARLGELPRGEMRTRAREWDPAWRYWIGAQVLLSAGLTALLGHALWMIAKLGSGLPLERWQRSALTLLVIGGAVTFAVRTVVLWVRLTGPRPRR